MSLTTARVRALNAVLDEGSYSSAARALNLSQPAISQAIQDLEASFGVNLFVRRGRRLLPTDLCLEIAELSSGIQRLEDDITRILRRGEDVDRGILRIGLGNLMPGMAMIGAFRRQFPNVQIVVEYAVFSKIIDAVLDRRVDVGILPNLPRDGRFTWQTYIRQDVCALVPPEHRLARAKYVSIRDLAGEKLIFQKKGSATQKIVDVAFERAGADPRPLLYLETGSEVFEAVASGLGIGFMWRYGTNRRDGAT